MKEILKDKKTTIILLALIVTGVAAYFARNPRSLAGNNVAVNLPADNGDSLRDAVAQNSVHANDDSAPNLALPADEQTGLRDAVAQNPAEPGTGVGGSQNPGPQSGPRGSTNGGTNPGQGVGNEFRPNGSPNTNSNNNTPSNISPSAPQD